MEFWNDRTLSKDLNNWMETSFSVFKTIQYEIQGQTTLKNFKVDFDKWLNSFKFQSCCHLDFNEVSLKSMKTCKNPHK